MKKQLVLFLTAASLATFTMPAGAVVLTPEGGRNVPSAYAKVIGGKVVFDKSPTAYPITLPDFRSEKVRTYTP